MVKKVEINLIWFSQNRALFCWDKNVETYLKLSRPSKHKSSTSTRVRVEMDLIEGTKGSLVERVGTGEWQTWQKKVKMRCYKAKARKHNYKNCGDTIKRHPCRRNYPILVISEIYPWGRSRRNPIQTILTSISLASSSSPRPTTYDTTDDIEGTSDISSTIDTVMKHRQDDFDARFN